MQRENFRLNLRRWEGYPKWQGLYDHYFATADQMFPPQERELAALRLYPLASYLRYWRRQIEFITQTVPPSRLLLLRVEELSVSRPQLARFVGLRAEQLSSGRSHAFQAPVRHGVLSRIDPQYVNSVLESTCGELERSLYQERA